MKRTQLALLVFSVGFGLLAQQPKEQPRHIDFTQMLMSYDGKLIIPDVKTGNALNLGDAACNALESAQQQDQGDDYVAKLKRDTLCRKIYNARDAVLTAPEVAAIEERLGKSGYSAVVVGAAVRLLDPAEK